MQSNEAMQNKEESTKNINNHESPTIKQNNLKSSKPLKKVYVQRNSYLTDLMEVNHLQSMYNIMVASLSLMLLYSVMFYISTPNTFWSDIGIMTWASADLISYFSIWVLMNLFAFVILEGLKAWIHMRKKIKLKIVDILFLFLYISSIIFMFTVTPYVILNYPAPIITTFCLSIEQVRIFMKIHSFVRESTPRVLQYKPSKDGDQRTYLYPSRSHYLYYLFAPALIYRDVYPRTEKIKWSFVFQALFQFFACIFIAYCFFMRFIVDLFRNTCVRPVSLSEASLIFAGATFVGALYLFLIFYCVLHTWLNFTAELMRFGDREFYQDWWNSTNFSQYYKKWNLIVYDWLYTYIYIDVYKLGFSRSTSMIAVFLTSALVHEYIIGLALGFFYPVLMVIYSTFGVCVKFLTRKSTSQSMNICMWILLFSGWGVIVVLYGTEWYARQNTKGLQDPVEDFFTPRSWSKTCFILDF